MAVSSIKDFWIHPNALTITINYFGDPQLIQTSMLAGAVIMAYRKDVISYDAAHNFREWKLQAFPTQLNDTCAYYVHAELSRSGDTAMIIYSPAKRDIEGRTLLRVEKDENGRDVEVWDNNLSTESYFIYLGTISASVDNDGATVERLWTDGFYTGTLDTDQQRMEDAAGEWKTMFNYNAVIGQIEPLKPFSKIKVMGEAIFQSIAQFVNGLVIGERTITDVAASSDSGTESKVSDATLPTTGYVQKEIEALDDHFLIKDGGDPQEVGGDVSFRGNVSVGGGHSVGGNQTIQGNQSVGRDQTIEGYQEVKGLQTLHEGFTTTDFIDAAGHISGAQLTQAGMFTAAGVKTMSLEVFELYYNVIRAQGSTIVLSSAANIDAVKYRVLTDDGYPIDVSPELYYESYSHNPILSVQLMIRKEPTNGNIIPFRRGDILYGYVNKIGNSGQYARSGQCIMEVTSTDEQIDQANSTGALLISAELFAVGTPSPSNPNVVSSNIPPTSGMSIAQRGNTLGTDGRTSCFFIDALEGRLYMLDNVTHPNLFKENYSVLLGKMPSDLFALVQESFSYVGEDDPVVYARYGIFENFLHLDHLGKPIPSSRYRGVWSEEVASGEVPTEDKYTATNAIYDTVTYDGSLWKCMITGTTDIPSEYSKGWSLMIAKGDSFRENLLNNTSQFNINWTLYNRTQIVDGFSGHKGLYRSRSAGDIAYQYITGSQSVGSDKVSPNEWYTLSFYVKGFYAVSVNIGVMNEDGVVTGGVVNEDNNIVVDGVHTSGSSTVSFDVDRDDDWTRHTISFLAAETVSINAVILFSAPKGGSTITISAPQLEPGKEATQWMTNTNDLSSSIVSELVRYATSDNGTTIPEPEGNWSENFPQNVDGKYIWTWTQVTYSTGQETNAYSVSRVGIDGKGIKSSDVDYSQQPNPVNPDSIEDWGAFPDKLDDGKWLYTRTLITYYNSDGTDGEQTASYSVSQIGVGSYYAGLEEWYAIHNDGNEPPTGFISKGQYGADAELNPTTEDWKQERLRTTTEKPYLWNFSISRDSRGNAYVTDVICIGNFAKGIVSIEETYAISEYSKPNANGNYPNDITDWVNVHQAAAPTEEKPYQWNRTATTYNDGTTEYVYHVSAVKGATPQGNLLKNSDFKKLNAWQSKNGTTFTPAQGEVLPNQIDGVSAFYAERERGSDSAYIYHDVLLQSLTMQPSTWYSLSFYCKGKCKLNTYTYPNVVDTTVKCRVDGVERDSVSDCQVAWDESTEYTFHYVSFKTTSDISEDPKNVLFRLVDDESIEINKIYICKPKLERSEVPTMWSLNEEDLIGNDAGNTYTLLATPDTIYVNKKGEVSSETISLSVIETTPYGTTAIYESRLQELGLSVQYLIASEEKRQPFDIGDMFLTDAKFTTVDFFLVHNGKDISTKTVAFPREGKDGNPPISYFAEPAIVNVQIDAQTQEIINNRTENVGVYARTPYGLLTEEDYYISLPEVPDGSKVTFGESQYLNDKYYFSVSFDDSAKRSEIPTSFSVKFHKADDESVMGELPITIAISERGLVGGQGASGPMLYPCGRLELGVDYVGLVKLKDGKPAALPIMYYQTTENVEGTYYVLQKDIYAKDNTKENLANTEYWEPFEKYKYIATDFLMANWAKLGSEDGAVFYDRYLFSQKCVDGEGYSVDITDPYTQRDMFDSLGNLTGKAVPNMIFDFKNGLSAVSNSIETYRRKSGSTIHITPETGYNISITPNIPPIGVDSVPSFFANNSIVILPSIDDMGLPEWQINGAHITITFETGGRPYGHTIAKQTSESMLSRNVFLLVCVDDSCLKEFKVEGEKPEIYATNLHAAPLGYEYDNFIFNRGIRGKYVIMAPGNTLRLRPYIWKDNVDKSHIHWMVDSPNVTEMGLTIYHTAYYLPSYAFKPNNGVNEVYFHNKKGSIPYERSTSETNNDGYWDEYRVYASKTELKGSGDYTEDIFYNLYPDQESVPESYRGVCFACGLINLLPDAIVINGFRIENNSESIIKGDYRCRAFNFEYDHDDIK